MKKYEKQYTGLGDIHYCKLCVQPDTRPGIYFNDEGICGACLYAQSKKDIDWGSRVDELYKIADYARYNSSNYNCVIGVSGGKDSTLQALYARNELNLHPLLVNAVPGGRTEAGNKNIQNLKSLGFDTVEFSPNPRVMKKLLRKDFFQYLNPVKITEYYLYASSYIVADKFNIPLIIQGENIALTLGASKTGQTPDGNALNVDDTNTLKSSYQEYLIEGVTEQDLYWFHYDKKALQEKGVQAIFLQYYYKDWSNHYNTLFAVSHGLSPRIPNDPAKTGHVNPYGSVDSNFNIINQHFKWLKFGFGHVTDEVCYDIRDGILKREDAIRLVERYDGCCESQYMVELCDTLGITMGEYWATVDKFYNRNLFRRDGYRFIPQFKVGG